MSLSNETIDECDLLISDGKKGIEEATTGSDLSSTMNRTHHQGKRVSRSSSSFLFSWIPISVAYRGNVNNQLSSNHSRMSLERSSRLGFSDTRETLYDIIGDDDERINRSKLSNKDKEFPIESSFIYRRRRIRLIILFCLLLCLLLTSIYFIVNLIELVQEYEPKHSGGNIWLPSNELDEFELESGRTNRWLVSSQRCHIPRIDPWHESIKNYVEMKPKLDCKKVMLETLLDTTKNKPPKSILPLQYPSYTYTRDNRLYFTTKAIKLGALNNRCCYRAITRSYDNDDDLNYDENCLPIIENGAFINTSLIKVECFDKLIGKNETRNHLNRIYMNIHSFIINEPHEEYLLRQVADRKLNKSQYYNIVLLGVDTISRLNGLRQLNRTLNKLVKDYETLDFVGYNKVGENTFPNLIPLLSGLRPEQLTETQCWLASNYSQDSESGDDYLDNCKYLWNYYQDLGYKTYFSEDWPKASTFNYLKKGFRQEPTTFYGRPFTIARDDLLLPTVGMGCASCLLDRPLVDIDLQNLRNFIKYNNERPYFAFHWINCPQHDDLNGASTVDYILEEFFESIKHITKQKRTFVIFFSDHGYRWNDFVSTRVGHYEASLPLLTIAAPRDFIKNHPDLYDNLKKHQSALLTPFDMFKTLIAIRNLGIQKVLSEKVSSMIKQSSSVRPIIKVAAQQNDTDDGDKVAKINTTRIPIIFEDPQYTQGPTALTTVRQLNLLDGLSYRQPFKTLSLLDRHKPADLDRSCIDAGIPDNYCVCHDFETIPTTTLDVLGAAYYYIYVHLYGELKDHGDKCYLLDLERIHKAELFKFAQMKKSSQSKRRKRRDIITNTTIAATAAANTTKVSESSSMASIQSSSPDTVATAAEAVAALTTTTPRPISASATEEEVIDEQHYLPIREYNIRVSTTPGSGLFQEVVRFYGNEDMKACEMAVNETKKLIDNLKGEVDFIKKHISVIKMNEACKFSIHSDSISRLNLYKDQSKCVKSNIELKKVCYCRNLENK